MKKTKIFFALSLLTGISFLYSPQQELVDDLVLENIEALSQNDQSSGFYEKYTGNCSGNVYYKKWVSCKSGGKEACSPSDC